MDHGASLIHTFRRRGSGLIEVVLDPERLRRELLQQTAGSYRALRQSRFHAIWNAFGTDRYGRLLWQDLALHNLMPDEGEQWLLEVAFSEQQSVPAAFEIGLTTEVASNIDENTTETLVADGTDGTEPSGNGYAREGVNSDNTDFPVAVDAGDYEAQSKTVTFTASGGAIPASGSVDWMFLATGGAGNLVSAVALSTARTIANGDSLNTSIDIKASE